jgi:hypothetical protein
MPGLLWQNRLPRTPSSTTLATRQRYHTFRPSFGKALLMYTSLSSEKHFNLLCQVMTLAELVKLLVIKCFMLGDYCLC